VPAPLLTGLSQLKVISCYGVGYDAIDVGEAASRGIIVTHTPNVLNDEVATTAVMLLMACYRQLIVNHNYILAGDWVNKGNAPLNRTIDGMSVGILGYGRIGQTIAKKLEAFGCKISYHARSERSDSPHRYYAKLNDMARDVQALIAITPGGAATKHLVNQEILEALGPEGCLVNVARGSVVDEAALVNALQKGTLGYAGLDVFDKEPQVPEALFNMPNVVLTPHIGSATVETRQAMGDLTVDNLVHFFEKGAVLTPVPECQHLIK
jgi:lactate dehydrogenase-like 2-hydroxyacid dehydrogenase